MALCLRCNNSFPMRADGRGKERRNISSRLRLRDDECSVLQALRTLCNYKVTYLLRQAFIVLQLLAYELLKRCILEGHAFKSTKIL